MTPATPTLRTFDPLVAGMVGLRIDPDGAISEVTWFSASVSGGPYTQVAVTNFASNLDGRAIIMDCAAAMFWTAKVVDSTGMSARSNEVQAVPSAGPPPPPTAQQALAATLGETINVGDQVALYAQPSVVLTVQSDGSLD